MRARSSKRGTSAHRQIKVFEEARARGASEREGFNAVVDWLIRETASGLDEKPARRLARFGRRS